MIRLPAARLLPITIAVTAMLLGLKSLSLGQAALASDSRTVGQAGQVQAVELPTARHVAGVAPSPTAPKAPPSAFSLVPSSAPMSLPSDWPLLQELRDRRDILERREHALDLREAALEAASKTLQTQLADLRSVKSKLEVLKAARQQRSDAGWAGIVKLYEAMRPSDAATIFNALDVHLLVQILDRMNERKAALIMGNMEPERARLATQLLALYRNQRDADPIATSGPSASSRDPGAG